MNIIECMDDPGLLGYLFKDMSTWTAWRAFLKSIYAIPFTDQEYEIYKKCTGRSKPPDQKFKEVYAIVGRKGGKSFCTSLISVYSVLFSIDQFLDKLAIGEQLILPILAQDKTGASLIYNFISGMLNSNPLFKKEINIERQKDITLNSGRVKIMIRVADYRAIRGPLYGPVVCLDELAFWQNAETFANPADEVITALEPGIMEGSLLIGISSAFSRQGYLFSMYDQYYGKDDPETLIWLSTTRKMNPTFSQKKIDRAIAKDRARGLCEYESIFRDDISSLFNSVSIDMAIVPGRQMLPYKSEFSYSAGIDMSGGKANSHSLCISHLENGKIIIDLLDEVIPVKSKMTPSEVAERFAGTMKSYKINKCLSDRYGSQWVFEAFDKCGIKIEYSDKNASECFILLIPEFSDNNIELPDSERLRNELLSLLRKVTLSGKDTVISPRGKDGSHCDLSNAMAVCSYAVKYNQSGGGYFGYSNESLYGPNSLMGNGRPGSQIDDSFDRDLKRNKTKIIELKGDEINRVVTSNDSEHDYSDRD